MSSVMSEHEKRRLEALRDRLQTIEDFCAETQPLRTTDFVLIGRVIQIYAYSTLNCRRILGLVQPVSRPKRPLTGNRTPDGDTFAVVRDEAANFPNCDLRSALIAACDILILHNDIRHHFAHWGVRRAKAHDAYVILGANEREVKKHAGFELDPDHIAFGVFHIPHLKNELRKLSEHGEILARIASSMDEMRHDLPRFISEGRKPTSA
jgi:hypothetical protein